MKKLIKYLAILIVIVVIALVGIAIIKNVNKGGDGGTSGAPQTLGGDSVDEKDTFTADGDSYVVVKGNAYKRSSDSEPWNFVANLYPDPDFYTKNYEEKDGQLYRKDPSSGALFATKQAFSETFEGATKLSDLINPTRGWNGITLLSPQAQSVEAYVKLGHCVVEGTCAFKDNRVEVSTEMAHSGNTSLKAYAVTPVDNMSSGEVGSKAALDTELLHFVNGDDFWYSGWYYVKEGMPFTIFELQSTWVEKYPGMRIMIQENDGSLGYEFKWTNKVRYIQPAGKSIPFPRNKWVNVKVHFTLSNRDDGVIQLWQDGKLVVDTRGKNLPFKDAIYNFVNVGIDNMRSGTPATTLFVDDVKVSNKPL